MKNIRYTRSVCDVDYVLCQIITLDIHDNERTLLFLDKTDECNLPMCVHLGGYTSIEPHVLRWLYDNRKKLNIAIFDINNDLVHI